MSAVERVVIAGAGQAGCEVVAALRGASFEGEIVLIGDEGVAPYSRPPLSKAVLAGDVSDDSLQLRAPEFYDRFDVTLRLDEHVSGLDLERRVVRTTSGQATHYDALAIATGGTPRPLPLADAPNVHYLRSLTDARALASALVQGARMVVVGGGYVGLEVAATAVGRGLSVTVVEAGPQVLNRVAGPELAAFVTGVHEAAGVRVVTDTQVQGVRRDDGGRVVAVRHGRGEEPCDLVVVGIGIVPNDGLAAAAGLVVDDGVVVDEFCRTSVAGVYAIGDCARHPCSERGGLRRLESVPNAVEHARTAALDIVGRPRPHAAVPWFWSDQFDTKIQSVGLRPDDAAPAVRISSVADRRFTAFYLADDQVRAADVAGDAREFALAKKLVAARARVRAEDLVDPGMPLADVVAASQERA